MSIETFTYENSGGNIKSVDLSVVQCVNLNEYTRYNRKVYLQLRNILEGSVVLELTIFTESFNDDGTSNIKLRNIPACLRLLEKLNEVDFYSEDDYRRYLNNVFEYVEEKYENQIDKIKGNPEEFFGQESINKSSEDIKNDIDSLLEDLSYSLES